MNTNVLEGISCPECGSLGRFRMAITVSGTAYVGDDGWEELASEESEFLGPAVCRACGHAFDCMAPTEDDKTQAEVVDALVAALEALPDRGALCSAVHDAHRADADAVCGGGARSMVEYLMSRGLTIAELTEYINGEEA